jgi:hypothetical protein
MLLTKCAPGGAGATAGPATAPTLDGIDDVMIHSQPTTDVSTAAAQTSEGESPGAEPQPRLVGQLPNGCHVSEADSIIADIVACTDQVRCLACNRTVL